MSQLPKSVTGHGTFIYSAKATISRYGSPENVAEALKALDMQHAWVRIHGAYSMHGKEPTHSLINALRAAEIGVAGWGWCQGEDIGRESQLVADSLNRFQLSDYIADIEHGVSHAHWTTTEITDFLSKVSDVVSPAGVLGVSSFAFIDWHKPELMKAANPLADFFAPQVYWFWYPSKKLLKAVNASDSIFPTNSPESYARLCTYRWKQFVNKPIIITAQAYWGEHKDYKRHVSEAKARDFVENFTDYPEIKGLNWWHLGGKGQSAMSYDMYQVIAKSGLNSHF